jgi:Leucine-rich repeat (LRR) protein
LTNLRELSLAFDGGAPISDFTPLQRLTNLEYLSLCGNSGLSDLRSFSDMKELKHLNLENTSIDDLTSLSGLRSLLTLNISKTRVTDLSPLSSLTMLTRLELGSTGVTDIDVLKGLTSLKFVLLADTRISPDQITSLGRALPSCRIVTTYDYW